MSLNVTGRCPCRVYSGTVTEREGRQFESSNIEYCGGWEERAALFLLVKRKLNHGGHGNREFALTSCNYAANTSLDIQEQRAVIASINDTKEYECNKIHE